MIETAAREHVDHDSLARTYRVDFLRSYAFIGMHVLALGAFFTGVSVPALVALLVTFWIRLFGITGGYHRYFSHRSFKTSRVLQFVLAWLGASAGQNGPLWWVSHHRLHHRHADTEHDAHSPGLRGFWWAHAGWIMTRRYKGYDESLVHDLRRFPELRFLDRMHMLAPFSLGVLLFGVGWWLEAVFPTLGATRWQMLGWGLFVSTMLLYHVTFLVNSVTHMWGRRRYATKDHSRNNWWVALLTLGEGWHNNHHRYPSSERQGFYWWELDVTHYLLRTLEKVGLVWELRTPPATAYGRRRKARS
ncbi:MAG: acyl-CoA desaturase [Gemmatimonadetes bacterium]|nr:acyl-CoA desaturase [Gemmatimonadota bacterium]